MVQENMINEIVCFVGQHHESTASITVFQRILGTYPGEINQEVLASLQDKLQLADPDEVEFLYYIIK